MNIEVPIEQNIPIYLRTEINMMLWNHLKRDLPEFYLLYLFILFAIFNIVCKYTKNFHLCNAILCFFWRE